MIYLHVPFCRSFCTYCDFYSEVACKGRDEAAFARWADGVCEEIEARRQEIESTLDLDTLYIGGGTPSVLPLSVLRRILSTLAGVPFAPLPPRTGSLKKLPRTAAPDQPGRPESNETVHRYAEFTIEVNPEDIVERGPEYVRGLLELGVTRISMGVQSLDDGILRWMNRRHSADGARKAFRAIRDTVREENIPCDVSIDLITGVPGMSMDILRSSLEEVISWKPEHISAYQLSIEEGSALARMIEKGEVTELGEEECRAQYDLVCGRLAEAGYHHYEISNWAIPGHEAVHNSAYWTRHPYVGLGPGAHSLVGNRRSWNSQVLSGWTSEGEDLTPEQIHEEEVMLLARTDRGPIPERDWFIADEIILQQLSS
ncbi:MAG: coproporphyrinogen III oxidase family protein [Bacteroidales bacterium]|nr:coproporphyrinogen III oxidase family protein [Bacteroidales bacterium]